MKQNTLQTLVTARALFEQAARQALTGDRYLATGGLIILQDAVELVMLAILLEKDVDENQAIEKFSFDDMLAAVGKLGIKIPKTGTLKAMNKLRVTAKHYGQVMDPATVQSHVDAARLAVDASLKAAVGVTLREILLTEIVGNTLSRQFLDEAIVSLENKKFGDALISTRKAFHVEFEQEYCIYKYRTGGPGSGRGGALSFHWEGYRSPAITRESWWIEENVKSPFDYIQIDYDNWRMQAVEWGINTSMLSSIQSLTPRVVRLDEKWYVQTDVEIESIEFGKKRAPIALDLAIEVIRRKHEHFRSIQFGYSGNRYSLSTEYAGASVYEKARANSTTLHIICDGENITVNEEVDGFLADEKFYSVYFFMPSAGMICGFVERKAGVPLVSTSALLKY